MGAIAQMGERLNGIQKVKGSIPFGSIQPKARAICAGFWRLTA